MSTDAATKWGAIGLVVGAAFPYLVGGWIQQYSLLTALGAAFLFGFIAMDGERAAENGMVPDDVAGSVSKEDAELIDLMTNAAAAKRPNNLFAQPYVLPDFSGVRSINDLMKEFSITPQIIASMYERHKAALMLQGNDVELFGEDIKNDAILNSALGAMEIDLGGRNFDQAVRNRMIIDLVSSINQKAALSNEIFGYGDGVSAETAIVVKSSNMAAGIAAEYAWLTKRFGVRDVDWRILDRKHGVKDGAQGIEAFLIEKRNGEVVHVFFNITQFYMGGLLAKKA